MVLLRRFILAQYFAMAEQLHLGSISRSRRFALFGASACLGASLLSGCTAEAPPNNVLTSIDCDDPKNNGGMSTPEQSVPPFIPADHEQANGTAHEEQLGDMPLKGFSAFLSDKAIQRITNQHPNRVYRVFYQYFKEQEQEGMPIVELLNFSNRGTTYGSKSGSAQHANGGWYLKWSPDILGFQVKSYGGTEAKRRATSCHAYDIDPHTIQESSSASVVPRAGAHCKDTPTQLGGYKVVSSQQADILCAAAAAIQPFDKTGTLKALVDKANPVAVSLPKTSGYYVRSSETIVTPDNFLVFPQNKLAEQIRPIHEWTHHIYSKAMKRSPQAVKDLDVAYDDMITNKAMPDKSKTFAVVNEETYLKKYLHSSDTQGHPYRNADEMTASTVTVLRAFPEQFMHEYDGLGPKDQARVRQAVGAVYTMLVAQNHDSKALKGLIPDIDAIRTH